MSTGTGRSVNAHILPFSLLYAEVAQGILFGPSIVHTVELEPTLVFLCEQRSAVLSPARRPPTWALSTVQSLARGKDRKRDLGSSTSPVKAGEGLPRALQQGEERRRSWELRDSETVGWEPGTSAPDGPAQEEGLLAPHSLPSPEEPFQGVLAQCSEVSPAPLFCLFWAGLLPVWGIALAQCAGEVFPQEPGLFTATLDRAG